MAVSTLNSHIHAAIKFQEQINSAYLVFGKTTPWTDDNNPPKEVEDLSEISELVGYKKLKHFSLARPLNPGETPETVGYPYITYAGQHWALIPKDKAYQEKARWLYAEAEILPTDFPLGMYRQVGVNLGVVPKQGVTKYNLLPSDVANKGVLQFYENREPQNRTSSVYVLEQFMIKV